MTDSSKPSYDKYLPMLVSNMGEMGVVLTTEQLAPMLVGDIGFLETLEEYYSKSHGPDVYMDTQDRDTLGDLVAKHLTNNHWPMYGSPEDFKNRFTAAMNEAVEKKQIISFGE